MSEPRMIRSAADVDEQVLALAEEVFDDYFASDARIDWEAFIDRLAGYGAASDPPFDFDFVVSPAVAKLQRAVAGWRRG